MDPDSTGHILDDLIQDRKVQVRSKRVVQEQISKYKTVLSSILDEQPELEPDTRSALLQELLANFEAAVLENVLVDGLSWDAAPEDEEPVLDPEDQLSDRVLETTLKRRAFPRHILTHVVHALKAERLLMTVGEPAHALSRDLEPDQDVFMKTLSAAAPDLVKHTVQVVKSISSLQNQASGLRQVLDQSLSHESAQIHAEVLGRPESPPPSRSSSRPIRRAVERAATSDCYVSAKRRSQDTKE